MIKQKLICLFILISLTLNAQMVLQDPVSAKVFNPQKYSSIKGSSFLYDKWIKGSVVTPKGIYKELELKLDLYSNTLFFERENEPYEFVDKVIKFILTPNPLDSSTYEYYVKNISSSGLNPEQYVRVLIEGKASLYKSDIVIVSEMSEINAGLVKSFSTSTRYFIKNVDLRLVKPTKKDILNAFKDKEEEINNFIESNKLSLRKESGLVEIVRYYNKI